MRGADFSQIALLFSVLFKPGTETAGKGKQREKATGKVLQGMAGPEKEEPTIAL